jgi:Transglutaminase-like superfamily
MTPKTMRRRYLREATVGVFLAQIAVRFVPPARLFAWAERPPRRVCRFAIDEARWVSWAVERVGDSAGRKSACLPRALAAQAMLRRRGISSRLCLGVARENGKLTAHAWVEIGQHKIVGGAEAAAFVRLAEFGGAR